ncbi:unnamed protein product [Notodromas monacha]|uniref:PNPLA domain-containing protein n=1 Tax=Notodromas monacha TaxID=399045 RepID=A0A7R9BV93_9CRUS|nr:unnamed protein product [Notodromas monacha]CAG0921250.1 unnamed protein product [Notodromas monacha]
MRLIWTIGKLTSDVLRVAAQARKKTLGPFSPTFNITKILRSGLEEVLAENAHEIVSGRLHVSMTRICDGQNVIVSHFETREDLIQALLSSSFIPLFSGYLPPSYRGVRSFDGGFSDNLPILDENTITVSPFCGESDICPRDGNTAPMLQFRGVMYMDGGATDNCPRLDENTVMICPFEGNFDICPRDEALKVFAVNLANTSIEVSKQNLYRFARILFPPEPEVLSKMCQQGFDDALQFLQRNRLISCTRCLSVQSTFTLQETVEEHDEYDPDCGECRSQRQAALLDSLPDVVTNTLQEYIDAANKGLMNWIFRHRGAKLISILSLPYLLPLDIAHATFLRFLDLAPTVGSNIAILAGAIAKYLVVLVQKFDMKRRQFNAQFVCQLAITEYAQLEAGCPEKDKAASVRNNYQFGFSFDLNRADGAQQTELPNEQDIVIEMNEKALRDGVAHVDSNSPSIEAPPPSPIEYTGAAAEVEREEAIQKILGMASHQEAVMAFYYRDAEDKVRVTEIFDVTETESEGEAWNNFMHDPAHLWENRESNFTASASERPTSTIDASVGRYDHAFARHDSEYFVEGDLLPSGPFMTGKAF